MAIGQSPNPSHHSLFNSSLENLEFTSMAAVKETLVEEKHETETMEIEKMDADKLDEGEKEEVKEKVMEKEEDGGVGEKEEEGKSDDAISPKTPGSRPTRERKTVERYFESLVARGSVTKPLSIEKGQGTQLKDIPNVAYMLSKRKPDDNLQNLHSILFGKKTKAHNLKKNIGQFSGYVWVENEEKQRAKIKEKLDKCVKEKLLVFCDILNIPVSRSAAKKDELSVKLLDFLESPHSTTGSLLSEKEQKSKKRKLKGKPSKSKGSANKAAGKSAKKNMKSEGKKLKQSPKEEEDETDDESSSTKDESGDDNDDEEANEVGSALEESGSEKEEDEEKPKKKKSNGNVSLKEDSESGSEKEEEEEKPKNKKDSGNKVTEKPKAVKKESKPSKVSSSSASKRGASDADSLVTPKKQKVERKSQKEENEIVKEKASNKKQSTKSPAKDSEKEGKGKSGKKAKAEPNNEEIHAAVVNILKEVDFNSATLSDIIRKLGSHFGVDLLHRKAEVKAIITDVINNMSDEEEGDDSEAENDEEKNEGDDPEAEDEEKNEGDDSDA